MSNLMAPARVQEINDDLFLHLQILQSGFFAALAALILALVAVFSLVHAVGRFLYGLLGLLLWALGLVVLFCSWLRAWAWSRSVIHGRNFL